MIYVKSEDTKQELIEHFESNTEDKDGLGYAIEEDELLIYQHEPFALKFRAGGAQTLSMTAKTSLTAVTGHIMEYSYDGEEWETWQSTTSGSVVTFTPIEFGTSDYPKVFVRGKNPNGMAPNASSSADASTFIFQNNGARVTVGGNVMSLINYENENLTTLPGPYAFCSLFSSAATLYKANDLILPATTMTNWGYAYMFNMCSSLVAVPELPATVMAEQCYRNMFNGCVALKKGAQPNGETLATSCYMAMYQNCSGLTVAPELPVTTLATECYRGMFYDCVSLTSAPSLPATSLAEGCYRQMFMRCSRLTTAPELPAETLSVDCYRQMFSYCTSFTISPELPATTLSNGCYLGLFYGCSNLSVGPSSIGGSASTVSSGACAEMFRNCASLITAPELPATSILGGCYKSMFSGCTSLTVAPELPATVLAADCYYGMFWGCTSLSTIPSFTVSEFASRSCYCMFSYCPITVSPIASLGTSATTMAYQCCAGMFQYTYITTPPLCPSLSLAEGCYLSLFEGCSNLTTAPVLPAPTLVVQCYRDMFSGCTSLNYIKCLATDMSASNCTSGWTNGVAQSGTFVKGYGTSWTTGVNGIPTGWVVNENGYPTDGKVYITYDVQTTESPTVLGATGLTGGGNTIKMSNVEVLSGDSWTSIGVVSAYTFSNTGETKVRFTPLSASTFTGGNFFNPNTQTSPVVSIAIPGGITTIGANFIGTGCNASTIYLPPSVRTINQNNNATTAMTNLYIYDMDAYLNMSCAGHPFSSASEHHLFLDGAEVTSVAISTDVTKVPNWAFSRCYSITSVTWHDGITEIGSQAFINCTGVTGTLTLPSGLTKIGFGAFQNDTFISGNLVVPAGVSGSNIGANAFYGTPITAVTLPEGFGYIDRETFNYCGNLVDIHLPSTLYGRRQGTTGQYVNNPKWGAFRYCSAITNVYITDLLSYVDLGSDTYGSPFDTNNSNLNHHIFLNGSELTNVDMSGIQPVGFLRYAFANCSNITAVTFPLVQPTYFTNGIYAFRGCTSLSSVTIPSGYTLIPEGLFYNCSGLTSVTLHSGITSIGNSAFYNCSSLTSISIPSGVTSIGTYAFYGCSSLVDLTIPESVATVDFTASNRAFWTNNNTTSGKLTVLGNVTNGLSNSAEFAWKYIIVKGNFSASSNGYPVSRSPRLTAVRIGGDCTLSNAIFMNTYDDNTNKSSLEFVEIMGTFSGTDNRIGYNNNQARSFKEGLIVHLGYSDIACTPTAINIASTRFGTLYVGDGSSQAADQTVLNKYLADADWAQYSSKMDLWYNYNGDYKTQHLIPS